MIAFDVTDMTCGHCVSTLTKALKAADANASVRIDLANRRVQIEPDLADAGALESAIRDAGYTPLRVKLPADAAAAAGAAVAERSRCCGHCP